ncbi:MAG: riboflavin kinase, partial [Tannerella sp.]|nr:riboflavin kinase [Tannerella sp.]
LDFAGDIYEKEISVFFLYRLRNDIRFPSVEALQEQLTRDERKVRDLMKGNK